MKYSHRLEEILEKIKANTRVEKEIELLKQILSQHSNLISDDEKIFLVEEINKLESLIEIKNKTIEEKHKDFIFSYDDISKADEVTWIIDNFIPFGTIGVIYGDSGTGKTAVMIHFLEPILDTHHNVHIVYIDGDMGLNKIKSNNIDQLIKKYGKRFIYAGKGENTSEKSQKLLTDLVIYQKNNPMIKYLVIEDSLTLIAPKSRGFINTELLYKNERKLRELGSSSLIIHHLNRRGEFADSQQIVNYADYTYSIKRNDFNSTILLEAVKISRFDIQSKAFLTYDKKIVKEVPFDEYNITDKESSFVNHIIDLLEDGEMNQTEILHHLEKIKFFTENKIGQKKVIRWLKLWADKGKWIREQRQNEKNAIFYRLDSKPEKLAKLPN